MNSPFPRILIAISSYHRQPSYELLTGTLEVIFFEAIKNWNASPSPIESLEELNTMTPSRFTISTNDNRITFSLGLTQEALNGKGYKFASVIETPGSAAEIALSRNISYISVVKNNQSYVEIIVINIHGSLELPQACNFFLESDKRIDGIIALGIIKKGQTQHNEYVASEAFCGLQKISLKNSIPLTNGIIAADNFDLINERSSRKGQNYGKWAAKSCLDLIQLKKDIRNLSILDVLR